LHVDQAIALRLRLTSRPPFYGRGRPIKFVCQVAFVWSEIMRDRKGRRWEDILALFSWLSEQLKTLKFARKYLCIPEKFKNKNLNREFIVYKRSRKEEGLKELREQASCYFNDRHFGIKFTNKDIRFDMSRENGRIEFPDRTLFRENPNTSPVPILPGRTTRK